MISTLGKPRDPTPMDISLPYLGPSLLPTPFIYPIYAMLPHPTSYRGKCSTTCISQSIGVSFVSPTITEENKPMVINPQPSQVSSKTKRNRCGRECQ